MQYCQLHITDFVNARFANLDPIARKRLVEALKFEQPNARFSPAFKLKRWDGKVPFCTVGGGTYFNLLDRAIPVVEACGYEIEVIDERPALEVIFPTVTHDIIADRCWPTGHPFAGTPIVLRDHQVDAIQRYLDNPRSVQTISTSAGKTIITAVLSLLVEQATGGRTLVIVPSTDLVSQTAEDYQNVGLDVGVYHGAEKIWNAQHTICSWQALAAFDNATRRDEVEVSLDEFLEGVVCVICDETHTVKGKVLRDLLCGRMAHIPLRWGLTGTIPKQECDRMCLLAALGPVVGEVRAKELQDLGILSNCKVDVLQLLDGKEEYATYPLERRFLLSDQKRLQWMADFIMAIAESGNTLVLVEQIDAGKALATLTGSIFVYGDTKKGARKKEYKSVQTATGKILVASYGVASTGISIPRLFNLVLLEPGKSFVRVIQSIGRGLRVAQDKDFVNIYDITSSLKFSKRHLTERKKIYKEAEYPFSVTKVEYR